MLIKNIYLYIYEVCSVSLWALQTLWQNKYTSHTSMMSIKILRVNVSVKLRKMENWYFFIYV